MKWFKHLSTASNDERISALEDKVGLEGYGFYFKMLELVAEVMDASGNCEVTYSLTRWGRRTNITSKKWLFLAQCCADVGLITIQRSADDALTNAQRSADKPVTSEQQITVKIPNLLKYRDNYSKNLQATNKQDIEVDIDKEVKEEVKEKETHIAVASADFVLQKNQEVEVEKPKPKKKSESVEKPDGVDGQVWKDWLQIRKTKRLPLTKTAFDAIVAKIINEGMTIDNGLRICCEKGWAGFDARWIVDKPVQNDMPDAVRGLSKIGQQNWRAAQELLAESHQGVGHG